MNIHRRFNSGRIILAFVVGLSAFLAARWLMNSLEGTSKRTPASDNNKANAGIIVTNPSSQDSGPKPFACSMLYSRICKSPNRKDPTGRVPAAYEGEVAVLRVFERIIRQHPDLPAAEIDELLAKEIYTPPRRKKIFDLYAKIRTYMNDFFISQTQLSEKDKRMLKERIDRVDLELPPPASIYADEPDLLTLDNAFYYRTSSGAQKIRIGGAEVYAVTSRYNLAFTLAHELAHAVGPCELRALGVSIPAFDDFLKCMGKDPSKMPLLCEKNSDFPEIFADWIATHVIADIIKEDQKKLSKRETRLAIYNTVRDICSEESDEPPKARSKALLAAAPSEPTQGGGNVSGVPAPSTQGPLNGVSAPPAPGLTAVLNTDKAGMNPLNSTSVPALAKVKTSEGSEEGIEEEDDDDEDTADVLWHHPSTEFRINGILVKHPSIQRLLDCSPDKKGIDYGIPSQCFIAK